ncbi:PhzF family phenazine biosynthesis protein [Sphingomonas morindae]|uniref:PhzF family phenazine biosynthesis protein n=1 Tax=Sphingomonas morindae TaxID=1541170 RepID=A0ABY4X3H0_9SPHN|nr:PhzF family phenazine biosynthesis protein [Sphingomonas morindae]USI71425.1 PhzF family phenazine biosynthesis protein [Sphingomonas morindae]
MTLPFFQVDAFADRPFTGNPAAVMLLEDWPDDAVLQAVASENNLSETAFLVPLATGGEADYALRWFTPTTEVVLCGHATLASGHIVLSRDPGRDTVHFATRHAGPLSVRRADGGYELMLPSWRPVPRPLPDLVAALGIAPPRETLWHDQGYAVAVLDDEAAVRAVAPDFRALARAGDLLVIVTAPGETAEVVSRAFAPGAGIDEDPVTGSAHGVITPYWAERLGRDSFTAYQASARGGHIGCRLDGARVALRGACVTVIEGQFRL